LGSSHVEANLVGDRVGDRVGDPVGDPPTTSGHYPHPHAHALSDDIEALIGRPAPEFTLETVDGTPIPLAGERGHPVVLFFVREFT
jgi:hypothetical protein